MTAVLVLFLIAIVAATAVSAYSMIVASKYGLAVPADEIHYAATQDKWNLRLCRHRPESGAGEPVILVPGTMANQFNFTLPLGESLVDHLVAAGYDCWCLDYRGARSSVPPTGASRWSARASDYVLQDVPAAIDYIRRETGYNKVHWVGHSLGGIVLYAYDRAFGADKVASAAALGAPPGFKGVRTRVPGFVFPILRIMPGVLEWFARNVTPITDYVKPPQRWAPVNWDNAHEKLNAQLFYNITEAIPYPAATELHTMAMANAWRLKSGKIEVFSELNALRIPLLSIFGFEDPFTPTENVERFYHNIENPDKRLIVLSRRNEFKEDYSHIDLVFGKNAAQEVFPHIVEWLEEHAIEEAYEPETELEAEEFVLAKNGGNKDVQIAVESSRRRIFAAKEILSQLEGDGRRAPALAGLGASRTAPKRKTATAGGNPKRKTASAKTKKGAEKKKSAKEAAVKKKRVAKKIAAKKKAVAPKPAKKKKDTKKKSTEKKKTAAKKNTSPVAKKKSTAKKKTAKTKDKKKAAKSKKKK